MQSEAFACIGSLCTQKPPAAYLGLGGRQVCDKGKRRKNNTEPTGVEHIWVFFQALYRSVQCCIYLPILVKDLPLLQEHNCSLCFIQTDSLTEWLQFETSFNLINHFMPRFL